MPSQPLIGQNQAGEVKTQWPTPNPFDEIMVAMLESKIEDYVALLMGTPPPQGSHPEQLLTQQIPIDWAHVQRTYAKDRTAQQTYNYSISYDEEGNAFPAFTRDYIVRRYGYVPLSKGTALAGFVSAKVTAAGTGYDQNTVANIISGSGVATPIVSNGAIVHIAIVTEGTATSDVTGISITGTTGAGATASLFVQPQTAVLVKEDFLRTPDSPLDGLWCMVRRIYRTMPGPILTGHLLSQEVRGEIIDTTSQEGLTGTLTVESGNLIIESEVQPVTSVIDKRVTKKMADLPDDEKWAYWEYVSIPRLLFAITNTIYCNDTTVGVITTTPVSAGGASFLRKHRRTVSYSNTYPNPDLSGSTFTPKEIIYEGKFIRFDYMNVLNDAITYDEDFFVGGACTWTETYTFSASIPSATSFAAGAWYVKSFEVQPFGQSMYKSILDEFYSAEGNPAI